jgi:hypothetical protein
MNGASSPMRHVTHLASLFGPKKTLDRRNATLF